MDFTEQLDPTGCIDDRFDCLDHWVPPSAFYRTVVRGLEPQQSNPSLAGFALRGFFPGGGNITDFQIIFQVVFDIKEVVSEIAGYIKRLGMVEKIHLLNRHATNPFS
jgi:hypothetical protein